MVTPLQTHTPKKGSAVSFQQSAFSFQLSAVKECRMSREPFLIGHFLLDIRYSLTAACCLLIAES
jgi:hypothetical protein